MPQVVTSPLLNTTANTAGRAYRIAQELFQTYETNYYAINGRTVLTADIPDDQFQEFAADLHDALIAAHAPHVELTVLGAIYYLGGDEIKVHELPTVQVIETNPADVHLVESTLYENDTPQVEDSKDGSEHDQASR